MIFRKEGKYYEVFFFYLIEKFKKVDREVFRFIWSEVAVF